MSRRVFLSLVAALFNSACEKPETVEPNTRPIQTTFRVTDFEDSRTCQTCHPNHYKEWSGSMHAYAMKDLVWFTLHEGSQAHLASEGKALGQFCVMCHSPVAFLAGEFDEPASITPADTSSMAQQVKEGITCDFCHSLTHTSPSTSVDLSANELESVRYYLQTGPTKYGPIEDPVATLAHQSEYHEEFNRSSVCRSCHDLFVGGKAAETTFTEWTGTGFQAMGIECQSCHMKTYSGYAADAAVISNAPWRQNLHRHTFEGADLALTPFPETEAQRAAVQDLMESAAELHFSSELPDTVTAGDTLIVRLAVTNLAGHALPSGVTFARQLWLEVAAVAEGDSLFRSGHLDGNGDLYDFYSDPENLEDPQLAMFRTVLYDASGDSGVRNVSVERMDHMTDTTIPAEGYRIVTYRIPIPVGIQGSLEVTSRLRFRPLPPFLLREIGHPELAIRLEIFDIATATGTAMIRPGA